MARPIYEIATEIALSGDKIPVIAKPYLDAMGDLNGIDDTYGYDSARGIVAYFLSNAGSWRGETARRIKTELKDMLK